jgi:HSP20 family protein
MSIQRWQPFREMLSLREAMDELLRESFVRPGGPESGALSTGSALSVPLNLKEEDEKYILSATLPGFKPEEVDVKVNGELVTITAQHSEERQREEEEGNFLLRERRVGMLSRSIRLPEQVRPDQAEARFEDGELVLTLPKAPDSGTHHIQISGNGQRRTESESTANQQHA